MCPGGHPPILTRSKLHEELLGEAWPFFVDGPEDLAWKTDLISNLQKAEELLSYSEIKLETHKISNISRDFSILLGGESS